MAESLILHACIPIVISSLAYQLATVITTFGDLKDLYTLSISILRIVLHGLPILVLYRLIAHPLAKYPGPLLGRVTDWYSVYHCLKRDRHLDFYDLHCKYGPIVRYGPNRISINTSTALHDIYGVQANTRKAQMYSVWTKFFKKDMSMATIDRKKHAYKRSITSRAMSGSSIKGLEESILKNVRKLCDRLLDEGQNADWSSSKDMTKLLIWCTSDIMGDSTFSRNWEMMDSEKNRQVMASLPIGVGGLVLVGHMPWLLSFGLVHILYPSLVKNAKQYEALSSAQTIWRTSQNPDHNHKDLFAALLSAKNPETGKGLSPDDLIAEAALLIIAGSDTVATATTSAIFYLLHYPSTYENLRKEIRGEFEGVEEIVTGQRVMKCGYLMACIDEAMRLSPPVGGLLPREILDGGLVVDGELFPRGVDVGVPCYALHHNSLYYPEPFKFVPERWLADTEIASKSEITKARSAFAPFSYGRAGCVGKALAYQEMGILLARIVWLFDMRLEPKSVIGEGTGDIRGLRGKRNEFQTWDSFVSLHEGPMVQFRQRA